MSDTFGQGGINNGPQAVQAVGSAITSDLMMILQAQNIQPGDAPSYELCKAIYTSVPVGGKLVDAPINIAQSQDREITIPHAPEGRLKEAFEREWDRVGTWGADMIIRNVMSLTRIYGIATLAMGARGKDPSKPLNVERLHEMDLFFNVLDPLNTAGSLVLDQDPNSPTFQRPIGVRVGSQSYHPANVVVMQNEMPLYINWNPAGYGFSGRSVFQRALFPIKSFVQTLFTDDLIVFKSGVLVAKMKQNTSNTNGRLSAMWGWKRQQVKTAQTGNVLSIGVDEAIESLDLKNLKEPYELARTNILKNIAAADDAPAKMLDQETFVSGFGEGSEDAKQIARRIDRLRIEMAPLYGFFDRVVQRLAWTPSFYEDLKRDYPEYRDIPYEQAFNEWRNSFVAVWPNLLVEPDSEKIKVDDVRFKSVVALLETLAPTLDPENRASLVMWVVDQINDRTMLFSSLLEIDERALAENGPQTVEGRNPDREPEVPPFAREDGAEAVGALKRLIEARAKGKQNAA